MQILRPVDKETQPKAPAEIEKSVCVSSAKIDKMGQAWKKESVWFRQELLGKLKVVAHFEGKSTEQLMDEALDKYVCDKFESSVAMRKMIGRSETDSK